MKNSKPSKLVAGTRKTKPGQIWGGRFRLPPAPEFSRINDSFPFDHRLLPFDLEGSIAYSKALRKAGLLTTREAAALLRGLRWIEEKSLRDSDFVLGALQQYEDVHSFVEAKLIERAGSVGKKLHTGRSRNDQTALDLRLFARHENRAVQQRLLALMRVLVDNAEKHFEIVLPGYTHLQRAQPILLSHYWMAYFEMLRRDWERFRESEDRLLVLPLGSGALAGSGFRFDRKFLAKELGLREVSNNSLDAVSDRDYALEFLSSGAILMMHLSRLAEDLILYSTAEFDFLELSDAFTSGSSIMPQKKNPDALELVRGKAGRTFANLQSLLVTMKGLPMTYNKDLQEDKEALFDTVDTLHSSLEVLPGMLASLKIKPTKMERAAELGYSNATDCADYLARRGLPFRSAHEIVGKLVLRAMEKQCPLEELTLSEFRSFSPLFGPDLFKEIGVRRSIEKKSLQGGTAAFRVRRAIQDAKRFLSKIQ